MASDWQSTACILCECNCGIVVQLEGRTLAKIRGDKEHPASQGYTCNKALRLDHYQNNRSRLTSPMRRRPDSSYEEIDRTLRSPRSPRASKDPRHVRRRQSPLLRRRRPGKRSGRWLCRRVLESIGARYRSMRWRRSNRRAWIDAHLYGGHTRGEFEHAEGVGLRRGEPVDVAEPPVPRTVLDGSPRIRLVRGSSSILYHRYAKMADFIAGTARNDAWCLAAMAEVGVGKSLQRRVSR